MNPASTSIALCAALSHVLLHGRPRRTRANWTERRATGHFIVDRVDMLNCLQVTVGLIQSEPGLSCDSTGELVLASEIVGKTWGACWAGTVS